MSIPLEMEEIHHRKYVTHYKTSTYDTYFQDSFIMLYTLVMMTLAISFDEVAKYTECNA